jgi:hypothetical protein
MSAPTRTRRTSAATTGRFNRPGAAGRSAATTRRSIPSRRPVSTQRRAIAGGWLQRRQPQKQSGLQRALGGVTGALPGRSKKGSSSKVGRPGKAGGLALLVGAAGLAFTNRDKVASMARRDNGGDDLQTTPATTAPVAPTSASPTSSGTPGLDTGLGSTATGTSPADGNAGDPLKP